MGDDNELFEREKPRYDNTTFPEPRPFQLEAHEALRQGIREGHRSQILMAPTGAGKTYLGLRVSHEALRKDRRALFMCDRITLINQTSETADGYGLSAHAIIQGDHWRVDPTMPFQIASPQTVIGRGWPDNLNVVIIDECFPGNTLISTPNGLRRIDTLSRGEDIYNACGVSQIASTFGSWREDAVIVRLSDGTQFECTHDHPIFTSMGWRSAIALEVGQELFRYENVRALWSDDASVHLQTRDRAGAAGSRNAVLEAAVLREILCQEGRESNAQRRSAVEGGSHPAADGAQAERARRERERPDSGSSGVVQGARAGLGDGARGQDAALQCAGLSASLQAGSGEHQPDAVLGIGRRQPWDEGPPAAGRKERGTAARPRVESVEVVKRAGGQPVYNLRIAGHPSYFANGVLVHNCHTQHKAWVDYITTWRDVPLKEGGPVFVGLSATPMSRGLGKLFTNLVNAATMAELTKSGVLVPMRVFSGVKINMKNAATSGGEWTDKASEQRGLEIIGDVVTEWMKHGEGRKTICFGATIVHCEEICRQFNEAGIMAAVFCATTTKAEREKLLQEYKKPDSVLRVLVSVEALAKGFDVKDVGCVIDCRPLRKSLSTFIQMIGRGLRCSPETGKVDCILLDHSGNVVRFQDDFADVFYNGLHTLDAGEKLDAAVRQEKEGDEKKACPKCRLKPFGKKCIGCGHEVRKASLIEHEAGEMREITIGKKVAAESARHLWEQCATLARSQGNEKTSYGRACHLFKSITSQFPPDHWHMKSTKNVPVTQAVVNKNRANFIQFVRGKAKGA